MPLLIGGGQVIETPVPIPPRIVVESDLSVSTAIYVDPTGQAWPLTDAALGWTTFDEVGGLGAVQVEHTTDPHPRGGARIRHTQDQPRVINWPLLIYGATHMEFIERWRTLARAFKLTHRRGPGRLLITRPDGTRREIRVSLQDGFLGEPGQGFTHDTTVLALYCEDPYWRATDAMTLVFGAPAPRPFLNPFPSLSSGRVLGDASIQNPGEGDAWPSWRLTGPALALTATNHTVGAAFTLSYAVTGAQSITVTSDPPTVRGPAGEVLTGALNWPGAVLWHLEPGLNDVTLSVAGASPQTRIEVAFVPRYEQA